MSDNNFQKLLFEELELFLDPMIRMGDGPESVSHFFGLMGWDIEAMLGTDLPSFVNDLKGLENVVLFIKGIIDNPPESILEFIAALQDLPGAVEPIINVGTTLNNLAGTNSTLVGIPQADLDAIPGETIEYITLTYLKYRWPQVYYFMILLGAVRPVERSAVFNGVGDTVRIPVTLPKFTFDQLPTLFSDPGAYFDTLYGLDFTDIASLGNTAGLLLRNLGMFMVAIGLHPVLGEEGIDPDVPLTQADLEAKASFKLFKEFELFDQVANQTTLLTIGSIFRLLSQQESGPGLRIEPFGEIDFSTYIGNWGLGLELDAAVGAIDITGSGFSIVPPGGGSLPAFKAALELRKLGEEALGGKSLLIGSTTGTRFEIGEIAIKGFFELKNGNEKDWGIKLELIDTALVIQGGDGDGFLAKILPEDGIRISFDLGLEYSESGGFKFSAGINSSTAIEVIIPVNQTLFNIIDFEDVRFKLKPNGNSNGMEISLGGTIRTTIGPFMAVVQNMGIKADMSLPQGGGNMGPLDVLMGFKPPNGIGMSIDAGGFKGGGFLSIEEYRYTGALQLQFAKGFNISAVCIVTTRLPGGEKGFSLLVLLTVEFSPALQLGMGFALTGIGGMLGLHRTMDPDFMRDNLKNGILESLLFPQDILSDPEKIISDLDNAFPTKKDHFVFGPMLKATWGDKSLVTIAFGLMLEIPGPRILLPGLVGISLLDTKDEDGEKESFKVLDINIAFLGLIDIPRKMISIDASIYNSKILMMRIEGDMAFRLVWGDNPNFVLSFGGFHPSFTPPPLGLDNMSRLSIIIFDKPQLKLYAETYFAITSNTFQFGGALVFLAKFGPIGLDAYFGMDTIFFFNPFRMEMGIEIRGAVTWNDKPVLALGAKANLSGPAPWHIYGRAYINIANLWDAEVEFDEYFGKNIPPSSPGFDVKKRLREVLEDAKNWKPVLMKGQNQLVTLADIDEGTLRVVPMGSLEISQNVVPLGFPMEKFGSYAIEGANEFRIVEVKVNGNSLDFKEVEDFFAPMEFREVVNKVKAVEADAYEKHKSGVQANSRSVRSGRKKAKGPDFEVILIDVDVNQERKTHSAATGSSLGTAFSNTTSHVTQLKGSSARKSSYSQTSPSNSAKAAKQVHSLAPRYRVVNKVNLQPIDSREYTQAEAGIEIRKIELANPALDGLLVIVPVRQVPSGTPVVDPTAVSAYQNAPQGHTHVSGSL